MFILRSVPSLDRRSAAIMTGGTGLWAYWARAVHSIARLSSAQRQRKPFKIIVR